VPEGGAAAGGGPGPNVNYAGQPQPEQGIIVKGNGAHGVDQTGHT
jgi:hypothetical protein